MAQILQPYKVPVVHNDLTPPETLADVFFALESLQATVADIFARVETRVVEEGRRVEQVRNRAAACRVRVQRVRERGAAQQATTVFSTSKFPAPSSLPQYPTLFSHMHEARPCYRDVEEDVQYLPAHPAYSVVGCRKGSGGGGMDGGGGLSSGGDLGAELYQIASRLNCHGSALVRAEMEMEREGLGRLPSVPSVGALLLFNSNINPYQDYQTLDNLISAGRERGEQEEQQRGLGQAPSTLLSLLPDIGPQGLDLTYKPSMGSMAMLALPENLPLDFLAADVVYAGLGVMLPSIAPSAQQQQTGALQITDGSAGSASAASYAYTPAPTATQQRPTVTAAATAAPYFGASTGPPPPPSAPSGPPPPPSATYQGPPPPPPAPYAPSGPPPPPAPISAPPAVSFSPPPAPPAPQNEEEEGTGGGAGMGGAGVGPPSFLDSIRAGGVSQLRSREESLLAAKKVQRKEQEARPLSMAEALKERLARRNGALSGKQNKESQRRDSLVVEAARSSMRLSQSPMLPPSRPPPPSLLAVGFAAVDVKEEEEGGAFGYTARPSFKDASDDSESDLGSEFSDDSRQTPKPPLPKPPLPTLRPTPTPAPAPAPPAPAPPARAPAPQNPQERRGSGLLDSSNAALSNMLNQAKQQTVTDDGSDEDDWD